MSLENSALMIAYFTALQTFWIIYRDWGFRRIKYRENVLIHNNETLQREIANERRNVDVFREAFLKLADENNRLKATLEAEK